MARMILRARLEESEIKKLLADLLPLTFALDADAEDRGGPGERWVRIESPHRVDFVAGEGLLVEVTGQVRWTVAGLPLSITILGATLSLRPSIAGEGTTSRLLFNPTLKRMDLKSVPGFADNRIAALINRRLASESDQLSWAFGETLDAKLSLGAHVAEARYFESAAGLASVATTDDALEFSLHVKMGFSRATT
jgi:hypothetical protein